MPLRQVLLKLLKIKSIQRPKHSKSHSIEHSKNKTIHSYVPIQYYTHEKKKKHTEGDDEEQQLQTKRWTTVRDKAYQKLVTEAKIRLGISVMFHYYKYSCLSFSYRMDLFS